jgi:hypothetical protein
LPPSAPTLRKLSLSIKSPASRFGLRDTTGFYPLKVMAPLDTVFQPFI